MGRQGNNFVSAEEIAKISGTINYEVVSLIGRRIPRVYLKNGKVENIVKYLL
jgi:alanine racemase